MTEGQIQKAVFDNLRARGKPGVVFWHVPNDRRSRRKAGFRSGVHDVHIMHAGEFFTLELKVERDGEASKDQLKFRDAINEAGGYSFIARGLDEALLWLEACGIIRKGAA